MDNTKMTLQHELAELQTQIAALEAHLKEKPEYGLGEGDPATTQQELDRALLQQLKAQAASLEQALSEITEGTYGTCVQCGQPIHPDRLAVLPGTRICIHCARR
jgi:RNA polymerase-binding transcription factor DksA